MLDLVLGTLLWGPKYPSMTVQSTRSRHTHDTTDRVLEPSMVGSSRFSVCLGGWVLRSL